MRVELRNVDGDEDMDGCIDEREAAAYLTLSVHTLRSWRRRRKGPRYIKFAGQVRNGRGRAGRVLYRVEDLDDFLAASTVPTDLPELPQ